MESLVFVSPAWESFPEWLDPEGEWSSFGTAPKGKKMRHFGIDFVRFLVKMAQKRLKKGQNRRFTVTYQ